MDFSTLITRLGRRRGFDGSTARLKDFVNDALQEIVSRRPDWEWLRRQYQFQTRAPETSSAGTFTNDSHAVGTGGAGTATRTGALIRSPDSAMYRIRAATPTGTTIYLPVLYPGTTVAGTASIKIVFDTYPLPPGCSQIDRIVATGNGWQTPIPQESMLPSGMAVMNFNDTETYPRAYALDHHTQILTPRSAPAVAVGAGTGLTGVYKYAYAFLNNATGEVGPLSPAATTATLANQDVSITGMLLSGDYGKRLFRTEAGGTELLFLADMNSTATSATDSAVDSTLGVNSTTQEQIGAHPGEGGVTSIRLWPPPDDEYLVGLTYFKRQKELVLDNEVPLLPAQYHHAIVTLAESLALGDEENHRAAAQKRVVAMEAIDQLSMDQDVDPNHIGGVGRGEQVSRRMELRDGTWPRFINQ